MRDIKQRFRELMDAFFKITTGIVCASTIYITCFWGSDVQMPTAKLLMQILITAALCSVMTFFMDYESAKSKKSMLLRIIGHYVYENIVVLGCGIKFEWFYLSDWKMIFGMVICVAMVFLVIMAFSYSLDYKTAQSLNKKLQER